MRDWLYVDQKDKRFVFMTHQVLIEVEQGDPIVGYIVGAPDIKAQGATVEEMKGALQAAFLASQSVICPECGR